MKNKIRQNMLNLMKNDKASHLNLYRQLFETTSWKRAKVVGVTMSTANELDTMPIIQRAWQAKKQVVIPKTFKQRKMDFFAYQDDDKLVLSDFGILEPNQKALSVNKTKIDLIIVPGLAFNQEHHQRIGYGGGFYDRYLADFTGMTISLVKKYQLTNVDWNFEDTDIPVQKLIVEGD